MRCSHDYTNGITAEPVHYSNFCSKMADPSSLFVTDNRGLGVHTSDLVIRRNYEFISTVICSAFLLFGLIYCFLGYRLFKMVMFLSGFVFGCSAVCLVYHKEPVLDNHVGMVTKIGINLGVGVLCGLVTMLITPLGLFLTGLHLGCLLTLANVLVVGQYYSLAPAWVPLSALLATSVLCAILILQWQKLFTVLTTSVLGAFVVMMCVDHLVEMSLLARHLYNIIYQVPVSPLCCFSWAIIGISPVLSLMGVFVQWKLTTHGLSHKDIGSRQKKQARLTQIRRREARRRPQETHRRCKPPPLKRYAGDVLAPSYLQSLREHQMGTSSSSSSISTVTHTMIDFDFETGSMVHLTSSASSPTFRI
ncbi:transmembrane protein 198-like [Osmerus mordax]|uniref:transmembrane protein 198-like n=1 Tax=Osmerus mordax TaxID=8014 RepID=UPI00350F1760